MIFRAILAIMLLSGCSNFGYKPEKHHYHLIEDSFKNITETDPLLKKIYQVLGDPNEVQKEKGFKYIFCNKTKTTDIDYSITLKNNKIISLIITPSEDGESYLKVDRALKIFSHLNLNKSQKWDLSNPHVVKEDFFYRTSNGKFEIQFNEKNKIDSITWFK